MELYHGSDEDFSVFDAKMIKNSLYGWGFSFSTDTELASDFGDKIYTIEVPDSSKILDFDTDDIFDDIYQKFVEDIESCGIDKEYIDLGNPDNFLQKFWMLQANYKKLLGVSYSDAMKRLTEIIKSFGYIGTKHADVIVLFDKDDFVVKGVHKVEENLNFSKSVSKILKESLSQFAYHFTTLDRYHQMVDKDELIFSKPYGTDVLINIKYGNKAPYYFSTTRVRDGRVGFSDGKDVRIELNTDFFNNKFKARAVNFFGARNIKFQTVFGKNDDFMNGNKYETENEDRIFSSVSSITGISMAINRVDIFLPIENDELPFLKRRYYDIYTILRDIFNTGMGLKTFIYNDAKEFNKQGKNITEDILKIL